jgi:menaquinone-dependent protoporphyrinogen IX oxidase
MKTAVIYKSRYGYTEKYAKWIANELGADLMEAPVKPELLLQYDVVIYGGGLYAGCINGIDLVAKNPCKNLVIFTVGLSNPDTTDYSEILEKQLPENVLSRTKVFHFRGGIDYSRLGIVHKGMMALLKKILISKPDYEIDINEKLIIATYGKEIDFTDNESALPLIDYVKSIYEPLSA